MLLVYAVSSLFVGLLMVEGSLAFYASDAAPGWLKERKLLQVFISGVFSFGIMIAIVLFMQFLVAIKDQHLTVYQAAIAGAVAAAGLLALRWVKKRQRGLVAAASAR